MKLTGRLLLKRRGGKRRRRIAPGLLGVHGGDGEGCGGLDFGARIGGRGLVAQRELVELFAAQHYEPRRQLRLVVDAEVDLDAPILARHEGVDLKIAFADQAKGHGLDAPSGPRARQLTP